MCTSWFHESLLQGHFSVFMYDANIGAGTLCEFGFIYSKVLNNGRGCQNNNGNVKVVTIEPVNFVFFAQ